MGPTAKTGRPVWIQKAVRTGRNVRILSTAAQLPVQQEAMVRVMAETMEATTENNVDSLII